MICECSNGAVNVGLTHGFGCVSPGQIRELGELCVDADIYDDNFQIRDLISAFVKVNIDDDIYYQNDMNNSSAELIFEEFEEIVARVFYGKVGYSALQCGITLLPY